jgi:hypothetical protein
MQKVLEFSRNSHDNCKPKRRQQKRLTLMNTFGARLHTNNLSYHSVCHYFLSGQKFQESSAWKNYDYGLGKEAQIPDSRNFLLC